MFWLGSGFIGWLFLLRIRFIEDKLPKFEFWSYARGFILALILGPISILFGCYLVLRLITDD